MQNIRSVLYGIEKNQYFFPVENISKIYF